MSKHKPLHPLRLEDPMEKAFRNQWENLVKYHCMDLLSGQMVGNYPGDDVVCNQCKLTGGWIPYPHGKMTNRDHMVAAEFAQWLGSPCGVAFIVNAMNEAGYMVNIKKKGLQP